MKIALLGGTRGMGRALARRMAERGDEVFLLGRKKEDLLASAADLAARGSVAGGTPRTSEAASRVAVCDLEDPATFGPALDEAERALGGLDGVIVTAGRFARQEELEDDPELCRSLLDTNFTRTVLFCEEARKRLLARGGGTLCVFSSVAGERGRKPAGIYGATKAGVSSYLEALDHRYHARGLRVVCVKPGFVKTGMTEGLKTPPFAGEPGQVATRVLSAIDRGTPVVYAPAPWALVMFIVRHLPRFVMRRVGF